MQCPVDTACLCRVVTERETEVTRWLARNAVLLVCRNDETRPVPVYIPL